MNRRTPLALVASVWLLTGGLLALPMAWAQTAVMPAPSPTVVEKQARLRAILAEITQYEQARQAVQEQFHRPQGEGLTEELTQQLRAIEDKLQALRGEFEQLVVGVDLEAFAPKEEVSFDWTKEVQVLLSPLLNGLKRLTARPRAMDRLRDEIASAQEQRRLTATALDHIDQLAGQLPDPALAPHFVALRQAWELRQQDLDARLAALQEQLALKRGEEEPVSALLKDLFRSVFRRSGRNFILACLAVLLVWVVLYRLQAWIREVSPLHRKGPTWFVRLFNVVYLVCTGLGTLLIFLLVLYLFEDWVLLALSVVVLVGIAWAAKSALPWIGYQILVLLGLAALREGERVVYNGVPWVVQSLTFYAHLVNPALVGGHVRLPLHLIAGLQSRPFDPGEPWFPTRVDDWVLLPNQTLARVVLQTPEIVQLTARGSLLTVRTPEFLTQPCTVLSTGFVRLSRFGIDYRHQAQATGDIPALLQSRLSQGLAQEGYDSEAVQIAVEFEEAGASALQLVVLARCTGAVAPRYAALHRAIQRLCVNACTEYGWGIPFPQLTLHMAGPADHGSPAAPADVRQDRAGAP
jgi:hypothetical protein